MTPQCDPELTITENRVKASADFFGAACKAGPWVNNPMLDMQLSKSLVLNNVYFLNILYTFNIAVILMYLCVTGSNQNYLRSIYSPQLFLNIGFF